MTTVAALLSESGHADAPLLLAHVLERDRSWLIAHGDDRPRECDAQRFRSLLQRRRDGVPVAYLIGSAGFYGRDFLVNQHVLVPRPETEHLVDEALGFITGAMRVLDVGTGCGAIACTIAAVTGATVDATDVSTAALEVAQANARRLRVADRCKFYIGDLARPVAGKRYDVIIANLPYIPSADLPRPPDPASFEPRLALDGGPDGLALYRKLMRDLADLVEPGGIVLLEAAPPTIEELTALLRTALPNFAISVGSDYAGLARYVKASSKRSSGPRTRTRASEATRSHGWRERR